MIHADALQAARLPATGRVAVNGALGLPPAGEVRLRTYGQGQMRGDVTLRFFTAGGVVDVVLPEPAFEDSDFDLWPWVLERLRERGRRGLT